MSGTDVAESKPDAGGGDVAGTRPRSAVARSGVLRAGGLLRPAARTARPFLTGTDRGPLAGRVLWVASLAPVCVLSGVVFAAFPLAALGVFRPVVVLPVAAVVALVMLWLGLALLRRQRIAAPWWSVVATFAVAVGSGLFTAFTHSEHVIPRRDAGSYIQIAYWLAHHHGLTYPYPLAAFGPTPGDLGFGSPAFYEHGSQLVPQFMTGWPVLLGIVDWGWGWGGMLVLPAVIGACAILAVAGLTARLVGACWAPLAALLLAGAWPVLRVAQSTFSEPLALLILAGGSCLLVDLVVALRRGGGETAPAGLGPIRRHAFVAGLVLAGGELVRLDFGIDFALALPVLAGLWLVRRAAVWPFLVGAAISGGLALVDAGFVTRPYVQVNISSVKLMVVAMVGVIAVTLIGALVTKRYGRSLWVSRWWRIVPIVGGCAVLVVALGFVIRPYVSVDHSTTDAGVMQFTETAQARLGLPLDGSRGYAEQSLWWVSWYLGWPVLAAALVGAVALTVRVLRGRDLAWASVLLVYLCSSVLVLLRPGITPDHPWADRRLVVEVLPGMVLFATWAVAAGNRLARAEMRKLADRFAAAGSGATRARGVGLVALPWVATAAVAVAMLVPIWKATGPVASDRTELGELAAMREVCAALRPNDSVVLTDTLFAPTIRNQCQLPVASLIEQSPASVDQVVASIRTAGRTPVIAGTQYDPLHAMGLRATRVMKLRTRQDQQQLVRRPSGTMALNIDFWVARP
ncbi:hypothetical protein GCM10023322_80660 [Rugosimonospora acidiphila]|uniref:Galactan 5-O-arabinofuranosyltransferase n=1 Tax=Rugosimonospora acidiphila TaxID=556531 RepID=A0ABP9SSK2_9ACTN